MSSSPWDYVPPEEMRDPGAKGLSYLGILSHFGLTMMATFGALFLVILFVILTMAFWEWAGSASTEHDDSKYEGGSRSPIQYNFNIPETAEVHFHTSPVGQIRHVVARPIVYHQKVQNASRIRHPPDSLEASSSSVEIPSKGSMVIHSPVSNQMQEPGRRSRSDPRNMRSVNLDQPEREAIQGANSNSSKSAHTILGPGPRTSVNRSHNRGSATYSDDEE